VDGSYVQDMATYAANHPKRVTYVPTGGTPHCLAKNWNIGAARVPASEPLWMFCATDIEWNPQAWHHVREELRLYPDCGIVRDAGTKWNVWIVRRWCWDLIAPMDEAYAPCSGEDDDVVMKCHASGIKVRVADLRCTTMEGGHASRLDMYRPGVNSDREIRSRVHRHFQSKWGIAPSSRTDDRYRDAKAAVFVNGRRRAEPPADVRVPHERGFYGAAENEWPTPLRLHLGCGRRKHDGFINVDVDEAVRPDYVLDVASDPWPWTGVDRIEAYHLIEHLGKADGEAFVRKCAASLRTGGTLVLECPDLGACVDALRTAGGVRPMWSLFGNQKTPWQHHRWGYTAESLSALLDAHGLRVTMTGPGQDYHAAD
jgi:predicted SAM-dependent methyltransferase